ncbi:spermatogenesis-associated protein 4 [Dunckerocampus dactyliophorus]|uniref:spermatogenesis-associated protein 4 n=1 Tax=Dunckerocampus dactyliophorus TaxID=161453 RepID=UPI00240664C8|nr:spermatogenesis-associated protein 4 [Dunckerocampus dactyliophorus]
MTGLPRDVIKWLQNLELSAQPMNIRRDLSSGYHVAEIFSRYYPKEFEMLSYSKGLSLSAKLDNWNKIRRSLQKLRLHLMEKIVYGTLHCKAGAAELLVQQVYTILTKHRIRAVQSLEMDFTDQEYQKLLPTVARPTANTALNSNLRLTEILAFPDTRTTQKKAEAIICKHLQEKAAKTLPERGHSILVKPRLTQMTSSGDEKRSSGDNTPKMCSQSTLGVAVASYKTITVNQPPRRSVHSC